MKKIKLPKNQEEARKKLIDIENKIGVIIKIERGYALVEVYKKPVKTMIIKSAPTPKFDLTLENRDENARITLALQSLLSNAGWLFLVQVFEENQNLLQKMIIDKEDQDGKPITELQADEARFKYKYLKELMAKPDYYLKKLQPHTDQIDELDPYHQKP